VSARADTVDCGMNPRGAKARCRRSVRRALGRTDRRGLGILPSPSVLASASSGSSFSLCAVSAHQQNGTVHPGYEIGEPIRRKVGSIEYQQSGALGEGGIDERSQA